MSRLKDPLGLGVKVSQGKACSPERKSLNRQALNPESRNPTPKPVTVQSPQSETQILHPKGLTSHEARQ